jgi:uncharacterized protein YbcI
MSTEDQQQTAEERQTSVLLEVSNTMVRLYKEQFGRGPSSVRTDWAGPDVLVTVLDDTLTPAERRLVGLGEHQRPRDTRLFFQYATVAKFCEPIEQITGRVVKAFHSSIDTKADGQAVEVFVLYPQGRGRAVACASAGGLTTSARGLVDGAPLCDTSLSSSPRRRKVGPSDQNEG